MTIIDFKTKVMQILYQMVYRLISRKCRPRRASPRLPAIIKKAINLKMKIKTQQK